jgi:hypothetical protein
VPGERPISPLILAELYEAGDDSFLDKMNRHRGSFKPLLPLIEKWKKDHRPWARQMRLRFASEGQLTRDNRVVFKRLFKQAWHDNDHELMGAFMHRVDGMMRRRRAKKYFFENRQVHSVEVLRTATRPGATGFTSQTRHYLRRRAWRYFRRLGFRDPAAYVPAVARALVRYTDDDVRSGENLLDNWGLMHACFGKSDVLTFDRRHTNVTPGRSLAELSAAPMFERHWAAPASAPTLLTIVLDANCRPVRVWAIQLLKRHHQAALASVDAELLVRLVDHADGDVAAFAAELLASAAVAGTLPVATWLKLLATRNGTVVSAVADAFRKHVNFDRVTLAQAVQIATSPATPVARLGLEILEHRQVRSDADRATLAELATARCLAVADAIARYAIGKVNVAGHYRLAQVIPFFDSRLLSMREGAFEALADDSPAATDPAFWSALLESPYDDVRTVLVERLKHRQSLPGASADALAFLWRGVLLNIHRGGRAKLSALKQVSRQVTLEPSTLAGLLPVLAVAIRSVRAPEARHGLAAIVAAVEKAPALEPAVLAAFPELQFDPAGACR